MVETLLGFGANVHIHGGVRGETPLHVAAALAEKRDDTHAIECAQMLLKSGAQPNVRQEGASI